MKLTEGQKRYRKYRKSYLAVGKTFRDRYLFGGNRIKALERDGWKCVKCGMTNEEHKKRWGCNLTVDHIDGRGISLPKAEKNNNLDNLQTLCCRCHGKKDDLRSPNTAPRPIMQKTRDGKLIRIFPSSIEASRVLKIHNQCIWNVLHGGRPTYKNCKWEFYIEQ